MVEASELRARLKAYRASQRELAEFMGVDHRVVHRIVSGERKTLSAAELEIIQKFFESREMPPVPREMRSVLDDAKIQITAKLGPKPPYPVVPLHQHVDLEGRQVLLFSQEARTAFAFAHPLQRGAPRALAVLVWNDAMAPRFNPDEIAFAVCGRAPLKGQDCVVEFGDRSGMLAQYERAEGDAVFCRLLNPSCELRIDREGLQLHAVVGRG